MSADILPLEHIHGEHRCSSELLASHLGIQHKNVLGNIRKYLNKLEELGQVAFETRVTGKAGSDVQYALLNEQQCTFILSLSKNNERTVELKIKLVKSFHAMKDALDSAGTGELSAQLMQFMQQQQLFNSQMMQQMAAMQSSMTNLLSAPKEKPVEKQTSYGFCRIHNIHLDHSPTLASKAKILARSQNRLGELDHHPVHDVHVFPIDLLVQAKKLLNLNEASVEDLIHA